MVKEKWDDRYDVKTVSTKLKHQEFSYFKDYCDKKGIKISSQLKKLIKQEIEDPIPVNIAGKNFFAYNAAKDNFSWRVLLDKGLISYVEDDICVAFLLQLKDAINKAIEERTTFLQKKEKDSVAVPSRIVRKGL